MNIIDALQHIHMTLSDLATIVSKPNSEINHTPSTWNELNSLRSTTRSDSSGTVFGVPLDMLLAYAGTNVTVMLHEQVLFQARIPILVAKCGSWLKKCDPCHSTMFESDLLNLEPASAGALRAKFDKSGDFGQSLDMHDRFSAADIAHVLREFLSALPEPVVPLVLYDHFCSILDDRSLEDHSIERVEATLLHMPSSSRELLLYMGDLIVTLTSHATPITRVPSHPERSSNKTNLRELVKFFQPVLLSHPERLLMDNEKYTFQSRKVLEFICLNLRQILKNQPPPFEEHVSKDRPSFQAKGLICETGNLIDLDCDLDEADFNPASEPPAPQNVQWASGDLLSVDQLFGMRSSEHMSSLAYYSKRSSEDEGLLVDVGRPDAVTATAITGSIRGNKPSRPR